MAQTTPTPTPPPATPSPGHFQTLHHSPANQTITITDHIYGAHTIDEPILVALLTSPSLVRLSTVHQHGITGFFGLTPRVTRFEHSVGAFLIVRSVGASLAEQVAALLHDVSHTVLSHVIDWALSNPGEGSFHEVHKMRFVNGTELPGVVARFARDLGLEGEGGGMGVFNEEDYSLVEQSAPHLCADRVDYALRDAVGFGKLPVEEVRRIFGSLRAYPDARAAGGILVMQGGDAEQLALKFARAYLAVDRDVWSNPAHIDMYQRAGRVIGDAVRGGALREEELWKMSDFEFWEALRGATDDAGREVMSRLESEGLPREEDIQRLPAGTKVRVLDPDVLCVGIGGETKTRPYQPLSTLCPDWVVERDEYIEARRRMLVQS